MLKKKKKGKIRENYATSCGSHVALGFESNYP
jgi:hypothetical protein